MTDQQNKKHAPTFEGFIPPTKNYFPMPNAWIDICAEIDNLAELKVVQYVLRHTWGYQEYNSTPKAITTDEFMQGRKRKADHSRMDKGTGLSNRSVIDGLRRAVDHGYLTCTVNNEDKARISKSYALKMALPEVKGIHTEIGCEESTQQLCTTCISDVKHLHSRYEGSTQRSEKDTPERQQEKNTLEKQGALSAFTVPQTRMLNPRAQKITQAGGHLHGMIPAAEQPGKRVAGDPDPLMASAAQAIRPPTDELGNPGHENATSTPVLSTNTATYPQARAKASSGAHASGKQTATASPGAITLSPSARAIFDAWCALFKVEVDLTPANAQAAEKLVKPVTVWCSALRVPIAGLLKEIMNWLYATDKNGYYKRGVKLFDVSREFEGWQSAKERALQNKTSMPHIPTREEDPYSIAALLAAQNPGFFA